MPETPRAWIAQLGGTNLRWELAPDGERVVVVTPPASTPETTRPLGSAEHRVVFVQHFFDELRRRVPLAR